MISVIVFAVAGCVAFAALAIILPKLARGSWAWVQETFGSPVPPSKPANLATFTPRTPRPFSKTAAQGFNRRKFDAIVGGRR